jgi:tripartite ATP-independent transporter DctM subunit
VGGIIPGILEAVFYLLTIHILCRLRPDWGPPGIKTRFKEKILSLKDFWVIFILFLVVMGGIYTGVFSPTEAAGVGAFVAFVIAFARKKLGKKGFTSALMDTMKTTAMIHTILIGAMILGYFMSVTRLPFELAQVVGGFDVNRFVILAAIIAVYVLLGCMMIPMAMIILTIPIVFPLVTSLGFDPIWFGIITVRIFEIAQVTPPVGMNIFIISGVAKDVPMETIYRGVVPFFIADIFHLTLLIIFPQLVLFLPGLMVSS